MAHLEEREINFQTQQSVIHKWADEISFDMNCEELIKIPQMRSKERSPQARIVTNIGETQRYE